MMSMVSIEDTLAAPRRAPRQRRGWGCLRVLAIAPCLWLGACASYRPLPLVDASHPQNLADIRVSAASMPVRALAAHRFDPSDGLDVTEVAMLAVVNNPDLRAQRDTLGVAEAQSFAAGLLPDPQVTAERDRPTSHQPDLTSAFNFGLSYDLGNLLTRSARVASAKNSQHAVHLNLLWSEWQTVAKARQLFGKAMSLRAQIARLSEEQAALAPLQPFIQRALAAGDLTYDAASAGLRAAADVAIKLADSERQLNHADHDLHGLLGLDANVALNLVGAPYRIDTDAQQVRSALVDMAQRRPDLRALQAGYAAQESKLRAAVLAQFPAITVGFVRARDTGNVYSSGLSVALALPLFDRNRGNIAIETATRQQLRDEYAARVLASRNDIDRLLQDLRSYHSERARLVENAAELARARVAAERSYSAGLIDWPTYLAIRANALAADSDLAALDQTMHEQAIALDTLAGGDWPQSTEPSP